MSRFSKNLIQKILFIGIFLLISLSASPFGRDTFHNFLVVWNVGQGQWVTALNENNCLHFDTGGEFFPWKKLAPLCQKKENKIFLSHWDWDHIGGLAHWPTWKSCIALPPSGKSNAHKDQLLSRFSACDEMPKNILQWSPPNPNQMKDANSTSHVVGYRKFLMPGDSPQTQERYWKEVSWISQTRVLVLGHHGSRTSTSAGLLERLPQLRMAVASARWARYHHPHAETEALLKRYHIALLRTEDWGNLWFEI